MDTMDTAHKIYDYTGGHPLLVSKICKNIDETFDKDWSPEGIEKAMKLMCIYASHNINVFT